MPSASGYTIIKDKSYCKVSGEIDNNAILETVNGKPAIGNLKKGSKCYLYFEKFVHASDKILETLNLTATTGATRGNKKLTYPVGLITSDEFVLAGGFAGTDKSLWLNTEANYWTMSPVNFNASSAYVFCVNTNGKLGWNTVNTGLVFVLS